MSFDIYRYLRALVLFSFMLPASLTMGFENETIAVVTEDWPPFNYLSEDFEVLGLSTLIVKKTLKQTQYDFSIQLFPWARAYHMAKTKPNVLIYSIFRSPERDKHFRWICPLNKNIRIYFFALKSRKDIKIERLTDAMQYRVGVIRNQFPHTYLKRMGFNEKEHLDLGVVEEANIKKLLADRVDLVMNSTPSIRHQLQRIGREVSEVVPVYQIPLGPLGELCMAMSLQTSDEVFNKVKAAFEKIN